VTRSEEPHSFVTAEVVAAFQHLGRAIFLITDDLKSFPAKMQP
jgi:hypothetical protein